jgi:transcriptional regulator with XRE-family HTH domain
MTHFVRLPDGSLSPCDLSAVKRSESVNPRLRFVSPAGATQSGLTTTNNTGNTLLGEAEKLQIFDNLSHTNNYIPISELESRHIALHVANTSCRIEIMKPEMIAERVKARMKAANMQQNELAAASGLPAATVNRIVNGNFKKAPLQPLQAISEALSCSVFELVDGERESVRDLSSKAQLLVSAIARIDATHELSEATIEGILAAINGMAVISPMKAVMHDQPTEAIANAPRLNQPTAADEEQGAIRNANLTDIAHALTNKKAS